MSKKEKRIARQLLRADAHAAKQARLRERPSEERTVRLGASPESAKLPRSNKDPSSIMSERMTWTIDYADREGSWSWGTLRQWAEADWSDEIEPSLLSFGGLSWAEIGMQTSGSHRKHHGQEVTSICSEAQSRWSEKNLDQYDEIFRFRLGSTKRLWGYRIRAQFHVVWWDPDHKIYPTELKNT